MDEMNLRFRKCRDGLQQSGVKLTHQRIEICREIAQAVNHPDVESVFNGVRQRIPTISMDTVYRTLHTLFDLGLIHALGTPRDRMRFDGNTESHHHFVCLKCGEAKDFYSDDFDRLRIPDHVQDFGTIEKTHVEVRGICSACSNATDSRDGNQ